MKSFKQILIEASERRLNRILQSSDRLHNRLINKAKEAGFVGFDEDDPFDVLGMEDAMKDEGDEEVSVISNRLNKLTPVIGKATQKDDLRKSNIALKIRSTNPELYAQYHKIAKPKVIEKYDKKINKISKNIDIFTRVGLHNDANKERARLENIHQNMQTDIDQLIGDLHRNEMKRKNKPKK